MGTLPSLLPSSPSLSSSSTPKIHVQCPPHYTTVIHGDNCKPHNLQECNDDIVRLIKNKVSTTKRVSLDGFDIMLTDWVSDGPCSADYHEEKKCVSPALVRCATVLKNKISLRVCLNGCSSTEIACISGGGDRPTMRHILGLLLAHVSKENNVDSIMFSTSSTKIQLGMWYS